MDRTAIAETANVPALIRKAAVGEPSSRRTAPTTGPPATAAMPTAERAELAPARSSAGTSRGGVAAALAGEGALAAGGSAASTGARTRGSPGAAPAGPARMQAVRGAAGGTHLPPRRTRG